MIRSRAFISVLTGLNMFYDSFWRNKMAYTAPYRWKDEICNINLFFSLLWNVHFWISLRIQDIKISFLSFIEEFFTRDWLTLSFPETRLLQVDTGPKVYLFTQCWNRSFNDSTQSLKRRALWKPSYFVNIDLTFVRISQKYGGTKRLKVVNDEMSDG